MLCYHSCALVLYALNFNLQVTASALKKRRLQQTAIIQILAGPSQRYYSLFLIVLYFCMFCLTIFYHAFKR